MTSAAGLGRAQPTDRFWCIMSWNPLSRRRL